jgi:hypothetical protein
MRRIIHVSYFYYFIRPKYWIRAERYNGRIGLLCDGNFDNLISSSRLRVFKEKTALYSQKETTQYVITTYKGRSRVISGPPCCGFSEWRLNRQVTQFLSLGLVIRFNHSGCLIVLHWETCMQQTQWRLKGWLDLSTWMPCLSTRIYRFQLDITSKMVDLALKLTQVTRLSACIYESKSEKDLHVLKYWIQILNWELSIN